MLVACCFFEHAALAKVVNGKLAEIDTKNKSLLVKWKHVGQGTDMKTRVFYTEATKFQDFNSISELKLGDHVIIEADKHWKTLEWMAKKIRKMNPKSLRARAQKFLRGYE